MSGHPTPEPEQEHIPWGLLMGVAVGALALLFAGGAWSVWILRDQGGGDIPGAGQPPPRMGQSEIGLVNQLPFELERGAQNLRLKSEARLNSYGWVDRDAGVIHQPVERAMDQLLEGVR